MSFIWERKSKSLEKVTPRSLTCGTEDRDIIDGVEIIITYQGEGRG